MIDFYKKADKKRRGELDFVPERIEEKIMLLLLPTRHKKATARQSTPASVSTAPKTSAPRRAFFDAYYECV